MDSNKYVILILAAGNSSRLGRPKQLVSWNQSTLLNHTIRQASLVNGADVFVTLGSNQKIIQDTIPQHVSTFYNPNWQEGIGSSIAFSVNQIVNNNYDAIILSVCDQPHITSDIYAMLISNLEKSNKSIIVSKYKTASGPPTIFSSNHFNALLNLNGDHGAKEIIQQNINQVGNIDFEIGDLDIDTENDLSRL